MANEKDNDALQQELDTVFETARCSVSGQPFDVTESGAAFVRSFAVYVELI